ncbi:putative mRNA (guanine-N(7)-)-methyltransferase [Helianthus anomalus]
MIKKIGGIVPSKVPLGEAFNDCMVPGKRYSFRQVIHQQRVLGRKVSMRESNINDTIFIIKSLSLICDLVPFQLGMVIDLTNITRYYSVNDWKKEGIKYVKINCKGCDSIPENEAVNQYLHEVCLPSVIHRNLKSANILLDEERILIYQTVV